MGEGGGAVIALYRRTTRDHQGSALILLDTRGRRWWRFSLFEKPGVGSNGGPEPRPLPPAPPPPLGSVYFLENTGNFFLKKCCFIGLDLRRGRSLQVNSQPGR